MDSTCTNPCTMSCADPAAGMGQHFPFYTQKDIPSCPSAPGWLPHWYYDVTQPSTFAITAQNKATLGIEKYWKTECRDNKAVGLKRAYTVFAEESPFCYEVFKTGIYFWDNTVAEKCNMENG